MRFSQALVPLVLASAVLSYGSAITYNVNLTIGAGSVTGDIVTDGTIGVINTANLIDWNLLLNDGTNTFDLLGPLSGSNSGVSDSGGLLTATATRLLFNFSGASGAVFFQAPAPGSGKDDVCFWSAPGFCATVPSSGEKVLTSNQANTQFQGETGTNVIGTSTVPEPSTLALVIAGVVLVKFRKSAHRRVLPVPERPQNPSPRVAEDV
jgi:hypothetical protein